ncbi:hypothetical protein BDW02DRAFT_458930, partial [Decorospora gaudefroyi]
TTTTKLPPFHLSAPPETDIWRKPPSHNTFNAPTHPPHPDTSPLPTFQRAKISFALPPAAQLRQYDQAGLLLHLTKPDHQSKWIKSGIEFYHGKPYVATVGCDAWADWSLMPMPADSLDETDTGTAAGGAGGHDSNGRPRATIEAKRERDALGKSLWIYYIVKDGEGREVQRLPIREVNWVFAEEEGWAVGVAGYVCRPTKLGGSETEDDGEVLEVEFEDGLEIE